MSGYHYFVEYLIVVVQYQKAQLVSVQEEVHLFELLLPTVLQLFDFLVLIFVSWKPVKEKYE